MAVLLKDWHSGSFLCRIGCWELGRQGISAGSLLSLLDGVLRMHSQTLHGSQEEIFSVLWNILQASWGAHGANLVSVPICAGVWE